jgi:hypothetical protein
MGGTITTLFIQNKDVHKIVATSTIFFQVVIAMFAMAFTIPIFLEQRRNFIVGLELSRRGLEMGERTVSTLEKLDDSVEDRLKRSDRIFDRIEKFLDTVEAGDHPMVKRLEQTFKDEMASLRAELKGKKQQVDDELNAALDEGEREAAGNIPEGT